MYLLDTNVISETRKPRPHPTVLAWISSIPESEMFLAAITMGELQMGVENLRPRDSKKATEIEDWIDKLASVYGVLPADSPVFREWSRLMKGRSSDKWEDALIAATARVHKLIVATRKIKDFEGFDVRVFNPFETAHGGKR